MDRHSRRPTTGQCQQWERGNLGPLDEYPNISDVACQTDPTAVPINPGSVGVATALANWTAKRIWTVESSWCRTGTLRDLEPGQAGEIGLSRNVVRHDRLICKVNMQQGNDNKEPWSLLLWMPIIAGMALASVNRSAYRSAENDNITINLAVRC